jgi:3-oxoacyl-[acyl-carrier-protein] synthase II
MTRRVAITGAGVVSPLGRGVEAFWRACLEGRAAAEPIPDHWRAYGEFLSTVWAPLPDALIPFDAVSRVERMQLDRAAVLALGAAHEAAAHAGWELVQADERKNTFTMPHLDPTRGGVFMGTGIGGTHSYLANQSHHMLADSAGRLRAIAADYPDDSRLGEVHARMRMPRRLNPFIVSMIMPNAISANLGIKFGIRGVNQTVCAACASGTIALGRAFDAIQRGDIDYALAGGAEYVHDDYGGIFRGFDLARTLAVVDNGDVAGANRPFDKKRTGFLFSQGGAGVLALEERDCARRRGAPILAEIAGYAESFDAHNIMMMKPDGAPLLEMLRSLLSRCDIGAAEIDYVNAHGTGTTLNDATEASVLATVFGDKPIVNSTKSLIGHTIGASGAIEAAATALSIRDSAVHPCNNLETPVADIDFAQGKREREIQAAITQSFAFGGHNAALLLHKP